MKGMVVQMKLFIDTANIAEIKDAYEMGVISGVTTNPSIIAKEGKEFETAVREIVDVVGDTCLIFAEVISLEADGMVEEAKKLAAKKALRLLAALRKPSPASKPPAHSASPQLRLSSLQEQAQAMLLPSQAVLTTSVLKA